MQFLIFLFKKKKKEKTNIWMSFLHCLYWNLVEESLFQCLQLKVSLWVRNWKWNDLIFYCRRRNKKSSWSINTNKSISPEIIIWISITSEKKLMMFLILQSSFQGEKQLFSQLYFYSHHSVCFFPVLPCRTASYM